MDLYTSNRYRSILFYFMRYINPISGKDSLATALVQRERDSAKPYEYMFNDVGSELPETYAWLDKVEKYLCAPIIRVGESLEDIMYDQGILPSPMQRYCTRMAKIYPMENWIGKDPAIVYYGIRADEDRQGYIPNKRTNIIPQYPLVEAGLGISEVYVMLDKINLLPPAFHWQALQDRVISLLGDKVSILDKLHPLMLRQLFAWRSRTNCYHCFFQRRYEWIGLAEYHPDLFEGAAQMEEKIGAKGYTWIQGIPLREYVKRRESVLEKRAKGVVKFITENEKIIDSEDPIDLLQFVSCGLFCGK